MAAEAGVKTVVLYHLIAAPSAPGAVNATEADFIDGVRAKVSGKVIVGQDLMNL